ncbi:MAG: hypothetical protein RMY36_030730 [Nostoc sp. SerVER01]|nr:hypothetical protein [Nostoc sp. SerVER01]
MYYEYTKNLHHLVLPNNIGDAVSYLNRLDWLINLHKIYQHFFPEEYEAHLCDWTDGNLINEIASRWELNLFELIDSNLFSLPYPMLEGEEPFPMIPVWPIYQEWWNSDAEDLPVSFQLVLSLSGNIDPPVWMEDIFFEPDGEFNEQKLKALCEQVEYPLSVLPKVVEVVDNSTNNVWMDSTQEYYPEFDWTIEQMEMLRTHWLEAHDICSQIADLDDWLVEAENVLLAVNIFQEAYEIDTETTYSPKPLQTVLSPFLE